MYARFFGLKEAPFGVNPDPKFLYMMPHVREALACLQYGIRARKGFVVLTGEVGTGKTTLLKAALSSFQGSEISTAFIFNPRLDAHDFFEFVLTDFGIPVPVRSKAQMLLALNHWLLARYRAGQTAVIVIDEAQNLSAELLEEIRLLTNLETATEKLVQIVLSGQPELEEKLREVSARQLRQRITLWSRTRPLDGTETAAYVEERLRLAGAVEPLFEPAAIERIYTFSRGIPRLINLLGEHSMMEAYVEQKKMVGPEIVESIARDFELDSSPILFMKEVGRLNHATGTPGYSNDGRVISVKSRGQSV
ncbi:MAG: AAA family ATPase [Acidobacteriales bacterium]|nr:AAA family ATPase [Terriglobales bacterium]